MLFDKRNEVVNYEGIAPDFEKSKVVTEQDGKVINHDIVFPQDLGVEHPFDAKITEGIYKKFGFAHGVVDKYIDFIVGNSFSVSGTNEKALTIIRQFMDDVNFDNLLRLWIKDALIKPMGVIELGGDEGKPITGVKVLDGKYFYVKRDNKGKVLGYNQYFGNVDKFNVDKVVGFESWQIAALKFNVVGNDAYGQGIINPAMINIENLLQNQKDLHLLMERKANSPYHVKLGAIGKDGRFIRPDEATVKKWEGDLSYLKNKHEWVTDAMTEITSIDFGNIGEKFETVLKYDIQQLFFTWQVPAVLMGVEGVPEGLADVQMEAFKMRIHSFQQEIERVIEDQIFRRVLNANGMNDHVEFEWGKPTTSEVFQRLSKIKDLMSVNLLSNSLRGMLEEDVVKLMDYDIDVFNKRSDEEERKAELERSLPLVPGQNKNPVPKKESVNVYINEGFESLDDDINDIKEWLNFDYVQYKDSIQEFLNGYDFEFLKAGNKVEEMAGKFGIGKVDKLREIMKDSFRDGSTIKEISERIANEVEPKDLYLVRDGQMVLDENGEPRLTAKKEIRPEMIARTEVTRSANAGAVKEYKKGGIKKVQWVATIDNRTAPSCVELDGKIFDIDNPHEIPNHVRCRCTYVAVTELDNL